ncbi:MAG: hypothetical protein FWE13_05280 [Firmicutes bacterium]|nr:hypothetical protein [Bacillota bacterium]
MIQVIANSSLNISRISSAWLDDVLDCLKDVCFHTENYIDIYKELQQAFLYYLPILNLGLIGNVVAWVD